MAKRNQSLELTAAALEMNLTVEIGRFIGPGMGFLEGEVIWQGILIAVIGISRLSIKLPVNRCAARFLRSSPNSADHGWR